MGSQRRQAGRGSVPVFSARSGARHRVLSDPPAPPPRRRTRRRHHRRRKRGLGRGFVPALAIAGVVAAGIAGQQWLVPMLISSHEPEPAATLSMPAIVPIGSTFDFSVTFDNLNASHTGYGPYVDVFMPVQGADGDPDAVPPDDGEPDGASLIGGSVTYLGTSVRVIDVPLACDGSDVHPFSGQVIDCTALAHTDPDSPVTPRKGDVLHVLELPFGSFTPTQPAVTVDLQAQLSELADIDAPLTILARGGFRFGDTPTGANGPIVQADLDEVTVTPTVLTLSKSFSGPENETATGPNYPRTWTVGADIAEGQTVTDLVITDTLPPEVVFDSVTVTAPVGHTIAVQPAVGQPVADGDDELVVVLDAPVTGTAGTDVTVTITFHVPETTAVFTHLLDPSTGASMPVTNGAAASANWDPIDDRDDPVAFDDVAAEQTFTARSLAVQKSLENLSGSGSAPGDVLEWTLEFQVSDYFAFDDLAIADVLTDGQSLVDAHPIELIFDDATHGELTIDATPHATVSVDGVDAACGTADTEGSISLDIALSDAVAAARDADGGVATTGGVLTGGRHDGANAGATTGTITFRTQIDANYRCLDDGQAVDSRDVIGNTVTIAGDVVSGTGRPTDGSSASTSIVSPALSKTVYARNGDTFDTGPQFTAGDTITYRLTATLPISNFEDVVLTDFLPLPVLYATDLLDAGQPNVDFTAPSATPPPAGTVSLGPDDTVTPGPGDGIGITPTVTVDTTGNSIAFDYGTHQDADGAGSATIDLLVSLEISDDPFADGLFLTNQLRLQYGDSFEQTAANDEIVQFELTAPVLELTKGAVATNGPGVFQPATVGPGMPWSITPDGDGRRWAAGTTVSSTALGSDPVDSDLTGVHAGDLVAFALVVENTGAGLNGAFDVNVTDTLPDGFVAPSGGIDLRVTDGAGTAIGYTGDLFAGGLTLTDDTSADPSQGAIAAFDDTSGANVAVITYVLEVDADVDMGQVIVNDAAVTGYAAAPGAAPYAPVEDRTATVTVALPELAKSITATSAAHTGGSDVVIGEVVTYEVVVSVPPSATEVVLRDELDAGLAVSALTSLEASDPGLTSSHFAESAIDTFNDILADDGLTTVSSQGRIVAIDLGTLTNSGENVETLTLTFDAAVTNVTANRTGTSRVNRAELRDAVDARLGDQAVSSTVTVVEPTVTVTKTVDDATPDADDTVTYTITVANTGSVDAFDVALFDQLPAGLDYDPGSLTHDAGPVPDTGPTHDTGEFSAGWNTFPANTTATFSYSAVVTSSAVGSSDGGLVTNTAALTWTSLPGTDPSTSDHTGLDVQRTGDPADPGEVNDYADSDDATINVAISAVGKWLTDTSAAHTTGANVTIGEVATFWLTVTLPEGDLGTVTVTDALPTGLAYVSGTLEVCVTAVDCDGVGMDAEGLDTDFDGTLGTPQVTGGVGDDLVITFDGNTGDGGGPGVTVAASPDTQQASSFVITYDAVVRDIAATTHGDTLTNTAIVTVAETDSDPASASVDIVEPELGATKGFAVLAPDGVAGYTDGDLSFVTSPTHAAANDTVEITIDVINTSGLTAFDVVVADQLDAAVFDLATVSVIEVETGWTDSSNAGAGELEFSIGELADGASASFTIRATVRGDVADQLAPTTLPHGHDNTAGVRWASLAAADDTEGQRRDGDSATAVAYTDDGVATLQLTAPDLVVAKTGPATIAPGGTVTYTITVTNVGGRRADGIELTDRLPEDDRVTFDVDQLGLPDPDIAYDATAGANGTITWQLGSLDPGQHVTRTVTIGLVDPVVAGSDGDVVANLAAAEDDGSWGDDLNPDDNDDTHEVTIDTTVALVVDKTRTSPAGSVGTGGAVVYEITVTNTGNEHVEGAVLTDTLAEHTSFASATPARDEDASSATEVVWPAFDLEAVAQGEPPNTAVFILTVEVDATVPSGVDDLTNTATVAFDGDEHTDTDTVVLDAAPEFTIDKTTTEVDRGDGAGFQPADGLIHAGDVVRYTITVANVGDQGATGVTITDTLPGEVTFVDQDCDSAPAHTVTSAAGVLTWTFTQEFDAGDDFTCTLDVAVDDPLGTLPGGPTHLVNTVEVTDDGSDTAGVPVTADDATTDRLNTTGITKTLVATSAGHTSGTEVVIGEVVTYRLVIDLPEGDLGEVVVRDHLAGDGLDYVDGSVTICDEAACDELTGDFAGTLDPAPPTVSGGTGGSPLLFTFADVEVDDIQLDGTGDPISNRFTITYDAVVTDVASNESATTLTNTVGITVDGAQFDAPDGVTVTIIEPGLELAKSFAFPDAHPDDASGAATTDTVTVELTVTNPSATSETTAFTIELVDLIDASLFGEPTNIDADGWNAAVASIDGGDTWQLTVEGASLAVGASHTITFDVDVAADIDVGDVVGNDASVTFTSLPGGDGRDYGPVTASDTFTVIGPDVDVDKSTSATTVEPGDPVTYTIEVTNTGSRQADTITVVDELPDELVYVASSGGFATVDYDADSHTVTWTVTDLAAGASADWQLEVTIVDPVPAGAPPITNTAVATYDGDRRADVASADDSATVSLDAFIDLVLDKEASAAEITPGDTVTYTLAVTNRGDEDADDVELTDTLPANTTFVGASNGGTETGGVVSWPPFTVAGSDTQIIERTVTIRLDDTVPAGLDGIMNAAEVTHADDVDTSNNTDTAGVDVDAAPELTITKDDGRTVALVGDTHVFTILVANVGDQGATGVTVVDTLPDGYSYAASSPAGNHVDGEITWNLGGELAAGDDVTLELTVTVDDPLPTGTTSLTNTVTVTDDGANGPQPTTDSDTDTNTAGTDLNVTIELIRDLVPGATGRYRITVGNAGPEDVDALTLVTSLDSALSNRRFDPDVGSYNPSTHVWSGVGLDVGDEITMTMTVDVALSASGSLTAEVTVDPIGHAELDDDDNTDETSDGLSPKVELELDKDIDGQPARGEEFDYVLTVTNHGPSRATGVRVTDTFPAGITPVASSGSGWTCTIDGRNVTCVQAAAIAPDATSTLRLTARVGASAEGEMINTALVTATGAEVSGDDRTGTATFVLGAATGRTGSVALTGLQVAGLLAGGLALTGAGTMAVGSVLRRRRT